MRLRTAPILLIVTPQPCPVERIDVGKSSCPYTKSVVPSPHVWVTSNRMNMDTIRTAVLPTVKACLGTVYAMYDKTNNETVMPKNPITVSTFLPHLSTVKTQSKAPNMANVANTAEPSTASLCVSPNKLSIYGLNRLIP